MKKKLHHRKHRN